MKKDPEEAGNLKDLDEESETEEDFESEDEGNWIMKLRIIAIVIIIVCAGSILCSLARRYAFGNSNVSLEDYDYVSDDESISLNDVVPDTVDKNNSFNPNGVSNEKRNEEEGKNVNSNPSESPAKGDNSTNSDGNKENEHPGNLNNDPIVKSEPDDKPKDNTQSDNKPPSNNGNVNDPMIDKDPSASSEDEKEKQPDKSVIIVIESNREEVINQAENPTSSSFKEKKPAKKNVNENTRLKPEKVLKPKPKAVKPKVVVEESEFEDVATEKTEIDEEEYVEPEGISTPSGTFLYEYHHEYDNMLTKGIYRCEFGEKYRYFESVFKFIEYDARTASVSLTADYKTIAYSLLKANISKIIVRDFEQMTTIEIGDKDNQCFDPNISPDGKLVIYRKKGWKSLYYYNLETGIETKIDLPERSIKYTPKFFNDSKRFAFVALLNKKFKIIVSNIYNTQQSKCVKVSKVTKEASSRPTELAISPNDRYIAFTLNDFIHVVPVSDKERLKKDYKFGMPLPNAEDSIIYKYFSASKKCEIIERHKFSRPFWSHDGMFLFFANLTTRLHYTGFGMKKYTSFDGHFRRKFLTLAPAAPEFKTKEIVKSSLDDILNKVELLNSSNTTESVNNENKCEK